MNEENKNNENNNKNNYDIIDTDGKNNGLLDKNSPLFLPRGSIRSLIALLITLTFILYLFIFPNNNIPQELNNILLLVLGFYFGQNIEKLNNNNN